MENNYVLVTGASGYIASHIVKQLLEKGYHVRGTVRSVKNEKKCQPIRDLCPKGKQNHLELVEADLTKADCWNSAVNGCKFVIHVASPCPKKQPRDESELIKPAVDGTLMVLQACAKAKSVKRVVLTSSLTAIASGHKDNSVKFDENSWTNIDWNRISPYEKSKTLAEKAAWEYVNALPESEKFELVAVNPGFVMGPMLHESECTSMEIIKRFLEQEVLMVPLIGYPMVDVRDTALAHIRAMEMPELAGTRNIVSARFIWFKEIAQILKEEFSPKGYKITTKLAPYSLTWLLGRCDPSIRMILPIWGIEFKVDNERMRKVLGIDPPVDMKTSIIEMANSLLEKGLIKKPRKVLMKEKKAQKLQK